MKRHLNLMTEAARFHVTAKIAIRRWALVLAAGVTMLVPLTIWHWQERLRVQQEHEAIEATYEPFKRLAEMNAELRTTSTSLVRDERLPLQLSRDRPIATLLGIVSSAVDATDGALFVEHLGVSQAPPGSQTGSTRDRLTIDVVCTPQFDISSFTDRLKKPPMAEVKITADDLITVNGVDAKQYIIECLLTGPTAPKAADAK